MKLIKEPEQHTCSLTVNRPLCLILRFILALLCLIVGSCMASAAPDPRDRQDAIDSLKSAQAALHDGQTRDAIAYANDAVRSDPTYVRAHLWLGETYAKNKQFKLAQIFYENVVVMAPNSIDAKRAKTWLRKHSTSRPSRQPGETMATQRIERLLLVEQPVEGNWDSGSNITVNGRVFDKAGLMDAAAPEDGAPHRIVFRNPGYDRLEAWIGKRGATGGGKVQFRLLGDGKTLYTSPWLGVENAAVRVNIPIRGYRGITLVASGDAESHSTSSAVWCDPFFIKRY